MALYRLRLHPRRSRGTRAVPDVQGRQRQVRRSRRAERRPRIRYRAQDRRRQGGGCRTAGGPQEPLHGRVHRGRHVPGNEPSGRSRGLSRDRRGLQALRMGGGRARCEIRRTAR